MDIAVSVRDLSKKYHMYDKPIDRLKEAFHPRRHTYHREFWALKNVSFDLPKGEALGIIGRNGCGKSTLLQIVSGILQPTSGSVRVNGRISALLELGSGFNPEFTGKNNVYMNGALMGFSKKEMDDKFKTIEEFAEIGDFIDQPVKTYSSGMFVRLAFACAISVEPDILVVDEALSVGDVFFQQKCFAKIREIISKGTTCLFVSHDTSAVMNICNRAILLSSGEVDFVGSPEETVSRYYSRLGNRAVPDRRVRAKEYDDLTDGAEMMTSLEILEHNMLNSNYKRHGAGGLEIVAARVVDKYKRDTLEVRMLEPLSFYILLRANEDICDPSVGIHIYDRLGNLVFAAGSRQLRQRLPDLDAGQELVVRMDITFNVQPGEYTFSLGGSERSQEGPNVGFVQDRIEMLGPIVVSYDYDQIFPFYGISQLPMIIHHYLTTDGFNKKACEGNTKNSGEIEKFRQTVLENKQALRQVIETMEFEEVKKCWCGGALEEWLPEFFPYSVCGNCGCKSVVVRQTEKSLDMFYSDQYWYEYQTIHDCPSLQDRYESDMADRIPVYLRWIQQIQPPPARVLEVGCGNGRLLQELTLLGYECSASEMDVRVANWVKEKTDVPVFVGPFPPDSGPDYDLIVIIDVLEHIYDPLQFVKEVESRLKDGGKVLLHCPVIDNAETALQLKNLFNPLSHLWMHSAGSMVKLWASVGLIPDVLGELFGMPCYVLKK